MFNIRRSVVLLRNLKQLESLNIAKNFAPYQAQAALAFMNLPKRYFSAEKSAEEKEEESHDDFKPQSKVQLDENTVFEQIDQVIKYINIKLNFDEIVGERKQMCFIYERSSTNASMWIQQICC